MVVIVELLSKIPDVMWSAFIASCLTLLGVIFTNRGHEKRQSALLNHERQKYKSEQRLTLKRDVFLNAAKSFANVLQVIPSLSNLNFSQKEIETQISEHSGIVAKSYLAAKESSVSAILDFSAELAESFLELMLERSVLLDAKAAIEITQSFIDSANNEKTRILTLMGELRHGDKLAVAEFERLEKNYELHDKQIKAHENQLAELYKKLDSLHPDFVRKCLREHSRLLSLLPTMALALRSELENDENPQAFVNALLASNARMSNSFNKAFDRMETD